MKSLFFWRKDVAKIRWKLPKFTNFRKGAKLNSKITMSIPFGQYPISISSSSIPKKINPLSLQKNNKELVLVQPILHSSFQIHGPLDLSWKVIKFYHFDRRKLQASLVSPGNSEWRIVRWPVVKVGVYFLEKGRGIPTKKGAIQICSKSIG